MIRPVAWIFCLTLLATAYASLPENGRQQTGDDALLKRFLMKNNRLPYANETVSATETAQRNVGDWTTCEGCKLLVTELRSIIRNPDEVAKVKELLSRFCQMGILSRYKTECLNMVNNLMVVLHEIEPLLDNPTAVCQELQYCPSTRGSIALAKHLALLLGFKAIEAVHPGRVSDVPCDECVFAITELKSLIQSASVQAELKQELHKLCRYAGQYETECSALVDQYFSLLIQELTQLLSDARGVCSDIGFCNGPGAPSGRRTSIPMVRVRAPHGRTSHVQLNRFQSTPNTPKLQAFMFIVQRMQTRQGLNAGCLVCRAAFTTAFDVLRQEGVATMVTADLTSFTCGLLPETIKGGCVDFMRIYSRAFLQMILSQYTPPQICSAMGVCKPEDERMIGRLSDTEKSAAVCEACQVLSQYISFEFQQRDFQQEVIDVLKQGCGYLPGDYAVQVQCETYLQTYTPYIMENVLAPGVTSLCETLKMCPEPPGTQTPA